MAVSPEDLDDWPVTGEVPGGPDLLYEPARRHLENRIEGLGSMVSDDHELATRIGEHVFATDSLKIRASRAGRKYSARFIHEVDEHKTEIATTLTVAGLLAAVHHLHTRQKK